MQHQMEAGDLLDAHGRLIERGWARSEVRRYDRSAIAASGWRIKEWDYYCIADDDHALALTVADNGYLGFLGLSWMDLRAGTAESHGAVRAFPFGRMRLPPSADAGDIVQQQGDISIAFHHEPGGRRLTFSAPGFADGKGLSGEVWLDQPADDRMVIATPFADAPKAFYYNQKINCMPATGQVVLGGEQIAFSPDSAFAVLDWGRGVWTWDNTWYWGSASGLHEGRRFGFNIGHGFGDTSAASENMLFLDGRAHKLGEVTFHLPDGPLDAANWRFTSADGRFEMEFAPVVDRSSRAALGPILSDQHQVFGRYAGRAVLDDGTALDISGLTGFAERVHNRW
ncbi:DUF2804 domain-containing protein [Tsuneonella suprasediminis]|uniref:DUF2804 domain-containing protein n=1 Tax=Tsuneonella suprasediminis TaxID=2306996 RepID=A0A419R4C5_9SPHN|nr:DUF2804 domain-containing protein [Tsuneonella suprasediminis]RJX69192.1 DUF2804 domain-containing protein [Tsuneonella suprasediminis]